MIAPARAAFALVLLMSAASLFASPVITSLTPNVGTVDGGATVLIRGTGFSDYCALCSPPVAVAPEVFFDGTPALDVEFIDSSTLRAITPPHIPGSVSVTVHQNDLSDPNSFTLADAFTYTGTLDDAFDPILFPIFSGPVHGQNGSEFRTTATVWNKGLQPVDLYGVDTSCTLIDPPLYPTTPFRLPARGGVQHLLPDCSQTPGRLFYVPKGDRSVVADLRVWETTRQSENHGVEIPVVRRTDFDDESIALVGVPNDPRFRLTLRVYGLNKNLGFVTVTVRNAAGQIINTFPLTLVPGEDAFSPSYASFAAFPPASQVASDELIVLVEVPPTLGSAAPVTPIWAFITVTNNVTQHITTITPHQE